MSTETRRGDIYYAELSPVVGSEQGGMRPVLIIQNNIGNRYSPTVIVAAITSRTEKAHNMPTHVELTAQESGLDRDSVVMLEQLRTIDKRRLTKQIGHLSAGLMKRVDEALAISIGLQKI